MSAEHERRQLARSTKRHADGLTAWGISDVPRPPTIARDGERGTKEERLAKLTAEAAKCTRCALYRTRTKLVMSDGSAYAKLMFIGEAPGRDEDLQGVPFVGRAGQLLTKMIIAMGLKREDVYICNVLKDRPPGNRPPEPEEMAACLPFLEEQVRIVQPRVICVLGAVAAKALLGPDISISRVRGQVREYQGIPLVPTFHPAYLLRNPPAKKEVWEDLKRVKRLLEEHR